MLVRDLRVGAVIYMFGAGDIDILLIDSDQHVQSHTVSLAEDLLPKIHGFLEVLEGPALDVERNQWFSEFSLSWG